MLSWETLLFSLLASSRIWRETTGSAHGLGCSAMSNREEVCSEERLLETHLTDDPFPVTHSNTVQLTEVHQAYQPHLLKSSVDNTETWYFILVFLWKAKEVS